MSGKEMSSVATTVGSVTLSVVAVAMYIASIAMFTETIYSYSGAYWALFAGVLLTAASIEMRRTEPKVRKVRGAILALGMVFSVVAMMGSIVHASLENTDGMDVNGVAAFAFFAAIGSGLLALFSLSHYTAQNDIPQDKDVVGEDLAPLAETPNTLKSSCCTILWSILVALLISSAMNVVLLASESIGLQEVSRGNLFPVDDHNLFARCMGEGEPTVFFSHGLGGNSLDFSYVQQNISTITRTCSYDRAGYGRSQVRGPQKRVSDRISNEEKELLDNLGIEKAIFVGHSFAGFNLRALESKHPELFMGLVLVDAVNPNTTAYCEVTDVKSKDFMSYLGMYVQPLGALRILNVLGLLESLAPISTFPEDIKQEYKKNIYKNEYFRTRNDEFDFWGNSCSFIDNLEGEKKLLDFPVTHVLPVKGIYSRTLDFAGELADLSVDGITTILPEEDITHSSILFDPEHVGPVIDAVHDMIAKV